MRREKRRKKVGEGLGGASPTGGEKIAQSVAGRADNCNDVDSTSPVLYVIGGFVRFQEIFAHFAHFPEVILNPVTRKTEI